MKISQADLYTILDPYTTWNAQEEIYRKDTLQFIMENKQPTDRMNPAGHITASAWILDDTRQNCLLIKHPKLHIWVQAGGHIEDDSTVWEAALREAREETGIHDLRYEDKNLFDLDVHLIPAKGDFPAHNHYDIRFLFTCKKEELQSNAEVKELKWIPIYEVAKYTSSESVLRMVEKSTSRTP